MKQIDYYRLYSDMFFPKRWYLGDIMLYVVRGKWIEEGNCPFLMNYKNV